MIAARRRTRSMPEDPACERVLAVSELLENIVVHLPARIILARMSGVSRSWNDVINASPAIQTKLWRRPRSDRVSSPVGLVEPSAIYYNSAIRDFGSGEPLYSGSHQINIVFPEAPAPLSRYQSMTHMHFGVEPVYLRNTTQGKTLVHVVITRDEPSEGSSETPSWLDMHLSEPPISTVWIEVFAETEPMDPGSTSEDSDDLTPERGLTAIQATVRDSDGVTFGKVRDAVDKIVAQPYHPRIVRDKNPAAIRICFVVDSAEISLPTMPRRKNSQESTR